MFERLGDVQQAADAEAFWAAWLVNHNIAGEALVHAKRASALLEDQPDSSEKAYAVMAVGRIESALDDPECWESLVAGAAIAERIGSLELRIRAKLTLGEERLCRDDPAGVQEVEEALRLARGQTSSIASLCKMCSVGDLLALGRITESRTVLNEGLEEAAELQLETIRQGLEAQFVSLAFTAGDWNTTHPITEAARARAQLGADAGSQQPLGAEVAIAIRAVVDLSDGRTIGECQ
jgi:hypothetical protein